MEALSLALLDVGKGQGLVRPVELAHDGHDWGYRRFAPEHRASCENGVVQWEMNDGHLHQPKLSRQQ